MSCGGVVTLLGDCSLNGCSRGGALRGPQSIDISTDYIGRKAVIGKLKLDSSELLDHFVAAVVDALGMGPGVVIDAGETAMTGNPVTGFVREVVSVACYGISRSALIRRMIASEWEEFRKLKLILEKVR
jgi:hypothetical protein